MKILQQISDHIKEHLDEMSKQRDPSEFNDEIALRTEWASLTTKNNSNSHKLLEKPGSKLFYRPTARLIFGLIQMLLLLSGFGALLLFGLIVNAFRGEFSTLNIFTLLIGSIFFGLPIAMVFEIYRPIAFDLINQCVTLKKERTSFSEVYAVQLLRGYDDKARPYYQINLVLRDASRIFIMNYNDTSTARTDAVRIARAMNLALSRIWDTLPGYQTQIS